MPERSRRQVRHAAPGFAEESAPFEGRARGGETPPEPRVKRLRLGPGGRLVIPADFRKAMEIEPGDPVTAILKDGELRLVGLNVAVRRAQTWIRKYVPEGVSLVDKLIEDRKREAEEEDRGG